MTQEPITDDEILAYDNVPVKVAGAVYRLVNHDAV